MNLRVKFTLYISLLLFLVIIGVSYNIFIAQKQFLTKQLIDTRNKTIKSFVSICTEAIKVQDELQVHNAINLLINTYKPAVVYAGYINATNVLMYASRDKDNNIDSEFRLRIKKNPKDFDEQYQSLNGEDIYEYSTPLFVNDENAGTFVVGFSQHDMEQQIELGIAQITNQIRIVAFIAIILAVLLANFLGYQLSKPLRMLTDVAEHIGKGNLDVQIKLKRNDEIGLLFNTFNDMAKKIKDLDTMKDSFVSSVSHELRSPLSAIDGYCDLLIEGVHNDYSKEQQLKGLQIIKQATIRLTNFINNILDLAKMKANKLEAKKIDIDISSIIIEITSLFKPLALQQKKNVTYEIIGEIPLIKADAEKIKQVVTNLVSNAMKFTKEGGNILLKVAPNSPGYGNDYIEVWVKDDGVGIPKTQVDLVFEKFYQVQEGEFKRPKGTGLGLTIVAEMIKLHHGYVWAESDIGQGTTFKFTLPKNK